MCGIAGLVGGLDRVRAEQTVSGMLACLARRGPDDQGMESWDSATLGHRRLSIYDLSAAGHQPMLSPDGRIGLVFNGAIYNFQDLRRELIASGFTFKSNSDTEVLLHGYSAWGVDKLVARLRGMYAFAIWDARDRRLSLVRDRLGVKPLVYAVNGRELAFASTPRALRAAGVVQQLDPQAMAEYLEFGFIPDPGTIYERAQKVPAATLVEWCDGRITEREYWTLPTPDRGARAPRFEEAVDRTEALLLDAVKLRLEADVPVGALLSGGIDSSLVCWAVAKLGAPITAFTVGTPGDPMDESEDAIATARTLGIRHELIPLSSDEAPGVDEFISAYGEPFACSSGLGMLSVSRAVRRRATVLLTGDGGDDVFLGYPEHRKFWMAQRAARALPPGSGAIWRAVRNALPAHGSLRRAAHFLDFATSGLTGIANAHPGLPIYARAGMLGERLRGVIIAQRVLEPSRASATNLLEEFLRYDRRMRFTGEYMTKVDGATMYHALEARAPFLDQEMWNYAAALPFPVRFHGNQLKAILREIARRHIGERVSRGRKRGFGIPVERWLAGAWRSQVEESFRDSLLHRDGWIHAPAVLDHLRESVTRGEASTQLWYLFVLERWLRAEKAAPPAARVEAGSAHSR